MRLCGEQPWLQELSCASGPASASAGQSDCIILGDTYERRDKALHLLFPPSPHIIRRVLILSELNVSYDPKGTPKAGCVYSVLCPDVSLYPPPRAQFYREQRFS